ncbi:MAG: hypothetical protein M1514_00770 [Patescibacteria group bacterium]|nr:hypothetical protein [Patescibacteria group bacterium]
MTELTESREKAMIIIFSIVIGLLLVAAAFAVGISVKTSKNNPLIEESLITVSPSQ